MTRELVMELDHGGEYRFEITNKTAEELAKEICETMGPVDELAGTSPYIQEKA